MKTHARVVIIGGGVMGVSLLYHLAKGGWRDVVLVEKNELTAGSTWHAAGLCTHFSHNATIMAMRAASVRLYRDELPAATGSDTGFHACGALRVTRSRDRLDEFRHVIGLGKFLGHEFHLLTPRELGNIYPLCVLDGIVGAIYEPNDGHVDPSLATNAMATAARQLGAQIYLRNEVVGISKRAASGWTVSTKNGDIRAEHVVNAAGTWCREIGTMMGIDLPVVPMLHQYIVTDRVRDIAERIADNAVELPIIRDPEESWYLRQERDGLIVGPYEKQATPWAIDGVPQDFGMELLPPDLDRVETIVAKAMARVPMLATAGIKTIVNGPITFTPDANPLIGPAFGLTNAWLMTGSSMGVMEGGGGGAFLARWMIDGAPPSDPLAVDARRFGEFADRQYRVDKAIESFGLQFGIHYPFEEREAGRLKCVSPLYELQANAGAVFGCAYGWERPNWFSRADRDREAALTFRRPGWLDAVGAECCAVAASVGIADLSAFSSFMVRGRGAQAFIDSLGANRAPRAVGRIGLTHALTVAGGVASEFSIAKLADDSFYLTSAAAAERRDEDLLRLRSAPFADVDIVNSTRATGVIALMGPNARHVLATLTDADLSNRAFTWLSVREIVVAGVGARALRVSYVGELGWELHVAIDDLRDVYSALTEAGRRFDIVPFGAFAMNAMRLEKGYRAWGLDLTTERTPLEAGLSHLVSTQDRGFIGRDALLARCAAADRWRMELLALEPRDSHIPFGTHTVFEQEQPIGIVTSGGYGHRTQIALALAYLTPRAHGEALVINIAGEPIRARILRCCPYDPDHVKLRDHD